MKCRHQTLQDTKNMTRKNYNLIANSIKELQESGITSGPIIRKITERFVEILNNNFKKTYSNYKEEKFFNKTYGK